MEPDFFGFLRPLADRRGSAGRVQQYPDRRGQLAPHHSRLPRQSGAHPGQPGLLRADRDQSGRVLRCALADRIPDRCGNNQLGRGNRVAGGCAAAGAPPFGPILADQRFTISRPSTAIYGEAAYEITDALSITVGLRYTWDKVKYSKARTLLFDLAGTGTIASLVPYSFPFNGSLPAVNQTTQHRRIQRPCRGRL